MTTANTHDQRTRIIIRLDATIDAPASIEVASLLAEALGSDLLGLFVEDEQLLQLAGLPFAHAVGAGAGGPLRLTPQMMEEAFSRSCLQCEKALSAWAGRKKQNWTFLKKRGDEAGILSATVTASDLLVVATGRAGPGALQVFRLIRRSGAQARCVVPAAYQLRGASMAPVVAIDDGDPAGARTIEVAARIAAGTGAPLSLIAIAGSENEAHMIMERAARQTSGVQLAATTRVPPGAPNAIAEVLMRSRPSFVVADLDGEPFVDDRTALQLLRAANAPTVLLRLRDPDTQAPQTA